MQCGEEMMTWICCIQLIGLLTSLESACVGLILSFSQLLGVPRFGGDKQPEAAGAEFRAEISRIEKCKYFG